MKHQLPAISDLYDVTAQDFLSNFNTLDDNIMKELSHSFVRLSLTPIIESFLSSDFRYSNNKKN